MYAGFTMGGLRVSLDGAVQREDGSVIPGLYAAGACAVNIAQDGKGYASGTQLAEGSYFGAAGGAATAARGCADLLVSRTCNTALACVTDRLPLECRDGIHALDHEEDRPRPRTWSSRS